jgi:D-tyrosyl-tRNA(Tyr) deacylase
MASIKKTVYFFCMNLNIDPVAGHVFKALSEMYSLNETDIKIDNTPVLKHSDDIGNEFYFVKTNKVLCHDYTHYLPVINHYFSDFDMAGLVTWHEGQNAPDKILSVHTTGDVDTGYFGNADPFYMHNLLWSLEKIELM